MYHKEQISFFSDSMHLGNNEVPNCWIPFKLNNDYHMYDFIYTGKFFSKFSHDAHSFLYDGYSITYSLLQLAIYMGFKEIILLGCDSNYSIDQTKQHFVDYGVHVLLVSRSLTVRL